MDTDSQAPTFWSRYREKPSFSLRHDSPSCNWIDDRIYSTVFPIGFLKVYRTKNVSLPMRSHSPLRIKLETSAPFSSSIWRSSKRPSWVQEPNFILHFWSSNGNQLISIEQVLLNIPGGIHKQLPSCLTMIFAWNVPSNFSSALEIYRINS